MGRSQMQSRVPVMVEHHSHANCLVSITVRFDGNARGNGVKGLQAISMLSL